jgi:hypothetical protein
MRVRVSLDFDILIEYFFSKEKATKKPIVSFDRVYQKTSKALGVSYTFTVLWMVRGLVSQIDPKKEVRLFTHFTKNAKYNNNLWEKCLSGTRGWEKDVTGKIHDVRMTLL